MLHDSALYKSIIDNDTLDRVRFPVDLVHLKTRFLPVILSNNSCLIRKIYYLCSEFDGLLNFVHPDPSKTAVTSATTLLHAGDKMANEALKQAFQEVHAKIVYSVSPDPVIDLLFSKKVLSSSDNSELLDISNKTKRCRKLLSLLHNSSHPQTFIYLRLALLDEYSWLVKEIDQLLSSPTSQLQQLRLDHSTDGINL